MNWDEITCNWENAPNNWESSDGPCVATAVAPAGRTVESPGHVGVVTGVGQSGSVESD